MILRRRRFARGALELNMPEIEVDLGEKGEVVGAHLATNDESHQIIEEFMLAANEAVASHLTERGVGFLRRAHADPEPRKLKEFAEFARSLGLRDREPAVAVRPPEGPGRVGRQARGVRGPLRPAAEPEAGRLHARVRGALRAGVATTTATSRRRSAAIPTSRSTASSPRCSRGRSRRATSRSWPRSASTAPGPSAGPRRPSAS